MRVILRSDVGALGHKGDVIDVADGYARNFLVPRGLAFKAADAALAQAESMRRSRNVRDVRERSAAEEVARRLVPEVIHVAARSGAGGRLFGSITASDVTDAVRSQTGVELDRRKVHVDEPIRDVGTHRVTVRLHTDVEFPVTVEVAAG
ncbi:MAG: 50S ribosomal protein L9 [Actinomycetota bacterium]|nr:50S ribosomal protein L9 [Actinomycetota bacterium]